MGPRARRSLPLLAGAAGALIFIAACDKTDANAPPKPATPKPAPETKAAASMPATPKTLDVNKVTRRDKTLKPLETRGTLTKEGTAALDTVLRTYLALKDALVTSDVAKVKAAYAPFEQAISALKKVTPPAAVKTAFTRQMEEIDEGVKWIAEHGATLPAHRRGFAAISEGVMTAAASFAHSVPVFVQHCPMALDEGAMWLSTSKSIRNPYYGDRMLECGEVQGEIPAS